MKNIALGKKLDRWAVLLSLVLLAVVVALRFLPQLSVEAFPFDIHILPAFHAIVNTLTAIMLLVALNFIRQKKIKQHQQAIYVAMGLSALFLVSYVVYHLFTEPTRYGGEGALKIIYLILLASHIILAALILPFIFFTFIRAYTGQIEKHRRMAKWVFPLWLYVAVTGPICYLMLMPYYLH